MNGLVVVGILVLEGGDDGFAEVDAFDVGVVVGAEVEVVVLLLLLLLIITAERIEG